MHPRNPYRDPPDFFALANAYPPLKPHITMMSNGRSTIDFQDDVSQRRLTEALLHRDFGIAIHLPENRLCPPIPNRLNYVLWLQDVIRGVPSNYSSMVRGIDIGTGASAIYPLLACKLDPGWQFVATDIDEHSLHYARSNVDVNGLQDRITIVPATPDGLILLPLSLDPTSSFDFTMCNPPFYSSTEDVAQSAEAKEFAPNAVCTGADVEMITPGGESRFVCQIVRESLEYRTRCRWYSSMLGKMSSILDVVALLHQHSIDNYAITEFIQGQTRRWAIAWSFDDIRLPDSISRIPNSNPTLQRVMPARTTLTHDFHFTQTQTHTQPQLPDILSSVVSSIPSIYITQSHPTNNDDTPDRFLHPPLLIHAIQDTWSRKARRKNKVVSPSIHLQPSGPDTTKTPPDPSIAPLKCQIGWICEDASGGGGGCCLEIQWVQGRDRALFESLYHHLSRKVGECLAK